MSYQTEYGIRWPVKPWGPLNKTGRLENAPPPRSEAEAREEEERAFRDAFELEDDEPICISDFEIWRRQQRSRIIK